MLHLRRATVCESIGIPIWRNTPYSRRTSYVHPVDYFFQQMPVGMDLLPHYSSRKIMALD